MHRGARQRRPAGPGRRRGDRGLGAPRLPAVRRFALLELRAAALTADGRFEPALQDAEAMDDLAGPLCASVQVRALHARTLATMRRSRKRRGGASNWRRGGDEPARHCPTRGCAGARCCCWPRRSCGAAQTAAACDTATLAIAACIARATARRRWPRALADRVCRTRQSRNDRSRGRRTRAFAIARETADGEGLANALNVLSFS